jgi:DNA-directed RNA polymerase subunit H
LVPKHEILSAKEQDEVLKTFGAKPEHLPKIHTSDPAAEAIGAKAGDLIRITRNSQTAGEAIYYRLVVEG